MDNNSRFSRQKGVAAIELAVILLPLLILCFGITELGRALYYYNGLDKATRGAVRYLSTFDMSAPPVGETAASIRTKAQLMAVCGSVSCNPSAPLVPGLAVANVSICDPVACTATHKNVLTGQGSVSLVTVTVGGTGNATYSFTSIVPWVIPDFSYAPMSSTMASQYF